jgi:hypothetical protein
VSQRTEVKMGLQMESQNKTTGTVHQTASVRKHIPGKELILKA